MTVLALTTWVKEIVFISGGSLDQGNDHKLVLQSYLLECLVSAAPQHFISYPPVFGFDKKRLHLGMPFVIKETICYFVLF